jgi:DDE superfamily endonuclease
LTDECVQESFLGASSTSGFSDFVGFGRRFDEKPFLLTRRHLTGRSHCQLIRDVLQPVNPKPGQVKREDYEYERLGTANLFGWIEPLTGNRDVWVTERRAKLDYAHALKRLSEAFPDAEVIVVVQDNLNSYTKATLYVAFPLAEARALARRFDFHFTPKRPCPSGAFYGQEAWIMVKGAGTRVVSVISSGTRHCGNGLVMWWR